MEEFEDEPYDYQHDNKSLNTTNEYDRENPPLTTAEKRNNGTIITESPKH
jgi:hypothetical protein